MDQRLDSVFEFLGEPVTLKDVDYADVQKETLSSAVGPGNSSWAAKTTRI